MRQQEDKDDAQPGGWMPSLKRRAVRCAAHLTGVLTLASLMLIPFVNQATLETFWRSAQHPAFLRLTWLDAVLYLGLAGCLWALAVILFEVITSRRAPVRKTLRLKRGSVMTETLIVLPIFLLLTFGIAQLAINNIAGLMTNAAVFQAGRTAWLWSSEAQAGRMGVTNALVAEMAHVQAAAVLTPVAPGEFVQSTDNSSPQFDQMRGILVGSQLPAFSDDTGRTGMNAADALLAGENMMSFSGRDSTFIRALDTSSWQQRTARKFTFAYQASTVQVLNSGGEVGVRLTYLHHQAFPLVGRIFGQPRTDVGDRPGFYSVITRSFTMPAQIPPNTSPF
jgi:hypothetical protein